LNNSIRNIHFKDHYLQLGNDFYSFAKAEKPSDPLLFYLNHQLMNDLNLNGTVLHRHAVDYFSANKIPDGTQALALAYAGHQFGHFNPQLGDGRAFLLGQINSINDELMDLHLKGSGPTIYSRNGDGLSALGPVIREAILCEAMHYLGVPTTRALAAVSTGNEVFRQSILPGGIITRVARGFIRVGTFQYFASTGNIEAIKKLADYTIKHYYPMLNGKQNPYLALLSEIINKQAQLIAKWMQIGFIHGVMNTDNMSVTGETIDYGPCAFMDNYISDQVYSSIDHQKRYAYCYQPSIALWNLTRLAECFLPLLADDIDRSVEYAEHELAKFEPAYQAYWLDGMRNKIGIAKPNHANQDQLDRKLIQDLFKLMEDNQADFTLTFYYLTEYDHKPEHKDLFNQLFHSSHAISQWLQRWHERRQYDQQNNLEVNSLMQDVNQIYIPRNHQVEKAIRAAEDNFDFSVFETLMQVLKKPFQYQQGKDEYLRPPRSEEVVKQTFCGT